MSSGELRPVSPPTREDNTPQKGMGQLLLHNLGYQQATWDLTDWILWPRVPLIPKDRGNQFNSK